MLRIRYLLGRRYSIPAVLLLLAAGEGRSADDFDAINASVALRLAAVIRDAGHVYTLQARVAAARSLRAMGVTARAAAPVLVQILSNPYRGHPVALDEAIVRALGGMGASARDAIPVMVQVAGCAGNLNREVADAVMEILNSPPGPMHVAVLIEQLRTPNAAERLRAAKNLATLGLDARAAAPALYRGLQDADPDVRRQMLRALQAVQPALVPTRAVLSVYIQDLTDPDPAVRLAAVKALALWGPPARFALPVLKAAARNDPDEDVRRVAGDAVGRIQAAPAPAPPSS